MGVGAMTDRLESLYAVVPHLPGYGDYPLHYPENSGPTAGIPPLDVLNMPEPAMMCPAEDCHGGVVVSFISESITQGALCPTCHGTEEVALPITVDLVVEWTERGADEAAHIQAVTGEPLLSDGGFVAWDGGKLPVGVVAARFHVTGCHQGEWLTDTKMCCDSPWARSDDAWWHWTGHAEKVTP